MYQGDLFLGDRQYRRYRKSSAESRYNRDLNAEQYTAVTCGDGPVLVLAGAGTGKTRTLVYRLAWLIEQGVDPSAILLLTFTRRAAEEMRSRAVALVGSDAEKVPGGTFHAVAADLLRRNGALLSPEYSPNFSILDYQDSVRILGFCRKATAAPMSRVPASSVLVRLLTSSDSLGLSTADYIDRYAPQYIDLFAYLSHLQINYFGYKRQHNLMDYNDLLHVFQDVLINDVRGVIRSRYLYVLVDEYQDTDRRQAEIVRNLSRDHGNVFAVGDDAQSVYGWRGADVAGITDFRSYYPSAEIMPLNRNYRADQAKLNWSNQIISKGLISAVDSGGTDPAFFICADDRVESSAVVQWVLRQIQAGVPLSEIAVLYRYNFHGRSLEPFLKLAGIPYEKRGGIKMTDARHVKDVLSFFRVLLNPLDRPSWRWLLTLLPGVGDVTAEKIFAAVKDTERPLEVFCSLKGAGVWAESFDALKELFRLIGKAPDPSPVLGGILGFYRPYFLRMYEDDFVGRQEDFDNLVYLAGKHFTLQSFLDSVSLDPPEVDEGSSGPGRIVLSTVHSVKGLEFNSVAVVGCAEGRWNRPRGSKEQYEEDRRLLYVAMTRAKRELLLSCPQMYRQSSMEYVIGRPVSYLDASRRVPEKCFVGVQKKKVVSSCNAVRKGACKFSGAHERRGR
ncbi:MAG: ATP-dependent helicase [Gammaproteobacteria bacterium]|nr:ATP-dependent helicase [Gammaproteobacteria bacterium]